MKKSILILISSILGLTALYFLLALYFNSHVFPRTFVDDANISWCSERGASDKINDILERYTLTLVGKDNVTDTLKGSDVSLEYVTDGYGNKVINSQNPFAWPLHLFKKTVLEADFEIVYNEDKLTDVINNLSCVNVEQVQPKDAFIDEYVSGVGFAIVPEVVGNVIDKAALKKRIGDALLNITDEINLTDEHCYVVPAVYSTDGEIKAQAEYLNNFVRTNITYQFGDDTVVVNGDMVYEWMTIKKNGKVRLDEEAVKEFVNSLGSKYDTIFRPRTFKTHYGDEVVISEGDYGWWMNRSAEVTALMEDIKNGVVGVREPVYFQKAVKYGEKDYGNTYVEVNLTAQHLFVYKKGKMVLQSDFVSGKNTKGSKTPPGVYGITYKERDATLIGEDYETPVSYWMPFNGHIGLHDAIWRTKFGSNLYKNGGSHGCINLPFHVAEKIYKIVEKGTAVICYELTGTESTETTTQGDKEIADFVVDAIDRIGKVTRPDLDKIKVNLERIRACYKDLTPAQKKYVTNLDKLVEAEKAVDEFK